MDNEVINIYDTDIEIAQNLCSSISDGTIRNRAVANVLAVKLAERYLSSKGYETDTATGLHNIPKVLESLDIADIYLNGAYIDVRVYFSNDEMSVPKFHFDLGINPAAYMFIKLNSDLSGYEVTGFIRPEYIDKNNVKDDYYYIDEKTLVSLYDIESHFSQVLDTFDGTKEMLYSFVDGSIDENGITDLLKVLITSANARTTLIKAFKASNIFKLVSPSIQENTAEQTEYTAANEEEGITESELDSIFNEEETQESQEETPIDDSEELFNALEYSTEITPNNQELIEKDETAIKEENNDNSESDEQIDSLFTGEQEGVPVSKKKKSSPFLVMVLLITLLGAGCYYAYTKYSQQNELAELPSAQVADTESEIASPATPEQPKEDAMPNETVNASAGSAVTEDASSVAIPAIEQHLDASVLVSNLKVDWEVPSGYASNTSAKRYLVKLGKVIQLNLKSELLLLSKPPIYNKISVELTYNQAMGKFDIVGIKDSSGEKSVDEVIVSTIKNALSMSTSSNNTESFGKLQGNPVLIIHL